MSAYDPFALEFDSDEATREFFRLMSVPRPVTETEGTLVVHDDDGEAVEFAFRRPGPTRGREAKIEPDPGADTLTVLYCRDGKRSAKRITVQPESCSPDPSTWQYEVEDYDAGKLFTRLVEVEVSNIRELAFWLGQVAQDPRNLLIRGEPLDDAEPPILRRGLGAEEHAAFRDRPGGKRWGMVDFDVTKLVGEFDLIADPEAAVRAVLGQLPEFLGRATAVWQLSSTAWLKGVRLHLFFWFDRFVTDDELVVALDGFPVDLSVYRTVQPHYVCNPVFRGVPDPLPRRWGLLEGETDEATFPQVDVGKRRRRVTSDETEVDADLQRANGIPVQDVSNWLGLLDGGALRCPAEKHDDPKGSHYGVHVHKNGVKCPHARCEGTGNGRGYRTPVALVAEVREVDESEAARLLLDKFDPAPKVEMEQLKAFAASLKRTGDNRLNTLGAQLTLVCKGQEVPTDAIKRLAKVLGEKFFDCDTGALAKYFEASAPKVGKTVEEVQSLIAVAQKNHKEVKRKSSVVLLTTEKGVPKPNLANALRVLTTHAAWKGVLAYDEFASRVVKLRLPPVRADDGKPELGDWTETDSTRAITWIASSVGFEPTLAHFQAALFAAAKNKHFHPVREYLRALRWDRAPRLDMLLPVYFGTADTPYARFTGAKWMISAVARIEDPGCKVDHTLVLESPQGWKKSSSLRALVPNPAWFSDSQIPIGTKDAYIALLRKWILEVPELDSFKRVERTQIKSFITSQVDNYRAPYAHANEDHPRQCAFGATTNEREYLNDKENRRWWPNRCLRPADIAAIERDRDQLWAEALVRYQSGETWWPDTPELEQMCRAEQSQRTISESWEELLTVWLHDKPDSGDTPDVRSSMRTNGISVAELQRFALGLKAKEMNHGTDTRTGQIMNDLGWSRHGRGRKYFPPPDWAVNDPEPDAKTLADVIGFKPGVPDQQLPQAVAARAGEVWDRARLDRALSYLADPGLRQPDGGRLRLQPRTTAEQPWTLCFMSKAECDRAAQQRLFSVIQGGGR